MSSQYCLEGVKRIWSYFDYEVPFIKCFQYNQYTDKIIDDPEIRLLKLEKIYREYWVTDGVLNRNYWFGPAEIKYCENHIIRKRYFKDGLLHRIASIPDSDPDSSYYGPAVEYPNSSKKSEYYHFGVRVYPEV